MAIDRAAVERAAAAKLDALTFEQLARRLDLSKARVRLLVAAGLLGGIAGERADDKGPWAFDGRRLNEWLGSLESAKTEVPGQPVVSFDYAARAFLHRGLGIDVLVMKVLDRSLLVAGVDDVSCGLKRLRFAKAAVREICEASRTSGEALTIQAVADRLQIKWAMAAHLVNKGLLTLTAGGVSEASVQRFSAEFVSGAALARLRSTSPRKLAQILAERNVRPVTGPGVDGGRQTFYARAHVDQPGGTEPG